LFYDDIVHEFGEITQNKGHYAVQGHARSSILVQIDSLLVINTNLLPILHCFRNNSLRYVQNGYIWLPFLRLMPPMERFPTSCHRKWYR